MVLVAIVRARAHDELGPYRLLTTITIPGFGNGFDISWVDAESGRYYLADRGNATATPSVQPRIDVIDTRHLKLLDPLPVHAAGNGVVAIHTSRNEEDGEGEDEGANELWVGDSNSFVEVIDLKTATIVADISTTGKGRADELAYDPEDHLILVANDRETIPFVTFISTRTRAVNGHLAFPQVVFGAPPTNHGLEQPVWNPTTRRFYLSVPGTSSNPAGEIDEIDPHTMAVTRVFAAHCNAGAAPQGLALVSHQRLVASCGDIFSVAAGAVI
jgi:hypothetical protein